MAKIDLSSKQWCDLVFEGRNHDYGAYKLRAEQGDRNKVALLVVIGLIILGILIPLFAKFVLPKGNQGNTAEVTTLSTLKKEAEVKDQQIKRVQPKPKQEIQRIKSSIKFTRPVIKKDEEVEESAEMKTQEELGKSNLQIAIADVKGNDEEHGKSIDELKEVVTSKVEDTQVYTVVEQMPTFPGGESALLSYIAKNIKYPSVSLEQGVQGTVVLRFVVTESGDVGEVQIIRGLDPYCDREAQRVVESLPKFIPGKQQGRAVKVWFTCPIQFRIE